MKCLFKNVFQTNQMVTTKNILRSIKFECEKLLILCAYHSMIKKKKKH